MMPVNIPLGYGSATSFARASLHPLECDGAVLVRPRGTKESEMMTRAAGGILLTIVLASASSVPSRAADEIKAGKWEFTTQIQLTGAAQSPPGVQASADGGAPMTRTSCIDAANPIPAETQCKLDRVDRHGSVVTWAMTCNSPRGPILSAGSGRYAGDTMEATLTARVPGPNGQPVDTPGHISGRYLGPCDAK
jgi:hypothetical protein